jgi:hypothetical protein
MREIRLNRDEVALVDDIDYVTLNQWDWRVSKGGDGRKYAVRNASDSKGLLPSSTLQVRMHRYILDLPDTLADTRKLFGHNLYGEHLDRNGLNNQRYNLVVSTASEIGVNKKARSNTYPGVRRKGQRYQVTIRHQGTTQTVGTFGTQQEAILARDRRALALYPRVFLYHLSELHVRLTSLTTRPANYPYPYRYKNNCYLCEYSWQQQFLAGVPYPDFPCIH